MKTVVVLAMHGAPPRDFPRYQVALLVGLHMGLERSSSLVQAMIKRYYTKLDTKIRAWLRTAENDPFHTASQKLAAQLGQEIGCEVIVGYNEFCGPSLTEALDQAAARGAEQIIVVTPMMTPGGEHAEEDIPAVIKRAEEQYPAIAFVYAWPFEIEDVAGFLAAQVERLF